MEAYVTMRVLKRALKSAEGSANQYWLSAKVQAEPRGIARVYSAVAIALS